MKKIIVFVVMAMAFVIGLSWFRFANSGRKTFSELDPETQAFVISHNEVERVYYVDGKKVTSYEGEWNVK